MHWANLMDVMIVFLANGDIRFIIFLQSGNVVYQEMANENLHWLNAQDFPLTRSRSEPVR